MHGRVTARRKWHSWSLLSQQCSVAVGQYNVAVRRYSVAVRRCSVAVRRCSVVVRLASGHCRQQVESGRQGACHSSKDGGGMGRGEAGGVALRVRGGRRERWEERGREELLEADGQGDGKVWMGGRVANKQLGT